MALLPRTAALLTTVTQCRALSQRAGARYLLVDGHNLIYRAFYAMPQLSRSGDRPVGAVMGVANTFLKLALPYSRVVFCLDPKGPGWREELFATAWKSTGELGYTFANLHAIEQTRLRGRLRVGGVETDAVMGTTSRQRALEM